MFKNNASIPLSILAEGLTYLTDVYMPSGNASVTSASSVLPGTTLRTVWADDPPNVADVSLPRGRRSTHLCVACESRTHQRLRSVVVDLEVRATAHATSHRTRTHTLWPAIE